MNNVYTLKKTNTKTFLLVGFECSIFDIMTPPPGSDDDFYYCERINNSFKAFNWLEVLSNENAKLPYAILVKHSFLQENDFSLLNELKKSEKLRLIPFIVIGEEDEVVDTIDLLKRGVDDYYPGKVTSIDLQKRIEGLNRFKTDMIQFSQQGSLATESTKFRMPIGKRIFDILFASTLLLALSPLLILLAILIKIESKGAVIYKSKRVGTGYQVFDFLKFRSMCNDADKKLKDLAHLNHYGGNNGNGAFMKLNNDPRITKVGKIIRKTSLDELPQLINVIRGEMSIVGNRPLPLYEAEQMTTDGWSKRFWAPAGITGLWQTSGEGKDNLSVEERVGLDIRYAEQFSFLMDATILTQTLPAMIQKEK